jgi:hypothetical protein
LAEKGKTIGIRAFGVSEDPIVKARKDARASPAPALLFT